MNNRKLTHLIALLWLVAFSASATAATFKIQSVLNGNSYYGTGSGSTVQALNQQFSFVFPAEAQKTASASITLRCVESGAIYTANQSRIYPNEYYTSTEGSASFDFWNGQLTDEGTYVLTVAAGAYKTASGDTNEEYQGTWTVKKPEDHPFEIVRVTNRRYESGTTLKRLDMNFVVTGAHPITECDGTRITVSKGSTALGHIDDWRYNADGTCTIIFRQWYTGVENGMDVGSTTTAGTYNMKFEAGAFRQQDGYTSLPYECWWKVSSNAVEPELDPEQPEEPDTIVIPEEPDTIITPIVPEEPDTIVTPVTPEEPDTIITPEEPDTEDGNRLQMGNNQCSFAEGDDYQVNRTFTYTATQRGFLQVTTNDNNVAIVTVDANGDEVSTLREGLQSTMPMLAGETVYVQVSPNMLLEEAMDVIFSATFSANDQARRGTSAQDPLTLSTTQKSITTDYMPGFTEFDTYLQYTADHDGALQLRCSNYVLEGRYGDSFGHLTGTFSTEFQNGAYTTSLPVTQGQTLYITMRAYTSLSIACTMTYPDRGISSNYPIIAHEGDNQVSADFGEFWYMYQAGDVDGHLSISSEYMLPRGHVSIYTEHNLYTPIAQSETGSYNIRFRTEAGARYYIYVLKTEESDEWPEPDVITLAFEPMGIGDTPSHPIALKAGEPVQLKEATGQYYYMLHIAPEYDRQMVEMLIQGTDVQRTTMQLYDHAEGIYYGATGTGSVCKLARAGSDYMLIVTKNTYGSQTLTPIVRDVLPGESIVAPIMAHQGQNQVAQARDVYYAYQATLDGRISVSFSIPSVGITFPMGEGVDAGAYNATTEGNQTRLDVQKGVTYRMHLTGITEDCVMTITESEYQPGETKDMALEMEGNVIRITQGMYNVWFRTTAAKTGKMVISSNMEPDANTNIYYMTDRSSSPSYALTGDEEGNMIYGATFPVTEGETIYVHYVSPVDHAGGTITCTLLDFGVGESMATAYELVPDGPAITVSQATRQINRWVRIPLNGATAVEITTDRFVAGGVYTSTDTTHGYDLDFTADANNEVHTAVYESDEPAEALYVCLTQSNGPISMQVRITGPVIDGIASTGIRQGQPTIYNINGTLQSRPARGIHIIRMPDGQVRKQMRIDN